MAGSFCLGYLRRLVELGKSGAKKTRRGFFLAFDLFIIRRFRFSEPEAG